MCILCIDLSQKSGFWCVREAWRDGLRKKNLEVGVPFPEVLVPNLHGQRGAVGSMAPSQIDMRQLPAEVRCCVK